ncbi:Bug family tripartite tricarboxylate transporter substrate binding protein [Comamonas endophytica]|uniref:Tripartite tricarboxylate transporter substrate binding protein n=1 Tax=Comamonas endophytica TaxID=2949090 RepID=A0ABY6GGS0_9BURK|nr:MULTISPECIES: tripartite tricarboxylate transporter substrate binding protein [unclassified Acidovorax]MCD2514323.1 tripartite tricarboxylate transporter substrate binding protein [Acidovorax sp. D4N7]UYG53572.1 tripartite tricarboxylate transporter substrate binding protein [Acidovorax sp. 5MLIR]
MTVFQSFPYSRRQLLALGLAATALAMAPGMSRAQSYPDKPLRLIVPFPAGGAADMMARGMALRLGTELGQQVVIENRGGAGGTTAAEAVARAPADGYTLFFATMGTQAINPALYAKLRYDPVKDFAPVALTHTTPRVLVVGAAVPARNVGELIALARRKPGTLTYGSAGNGSSSHLSGALFEALAGVQMMHVPYKGSAPLLTDVLAGRVDMTFDSYTVYEEHIRSGRARALGVTSRTRLGALPDVPTLAESGLAGYDVSNWLGVLAPAGTPKPVIDKLNAALVRAMATPELRRQLIALGIEPASSSPEEFAQLVRSEIAKWRGIVRQSGAKVD